MAFCPNCGSQVSGQFCPGCGTNVTGNVAPVGGTSVSSSSGMATNLASALCYFPIVAIIFLLIEPYNKNPEVKFHAWQSIFLSVAYIVLRIAMGIMMSLPMGLGVLLALIGVFVGLGELILVLFLAFKAYQNQRIVLPVIGPLAEQQAGR